ncbi:hypothetical protein GCM10023063_15510 [Arthrobacter methylotrophus]|uniref:Uncharacterized protein n=1 Tax=Arthrobacter methylotrophus TaxID=121291 RepID=A0ABV5UN82_9MICC
MVVDVAALPEPTCQPVIPTTNKTIQDDTGPWEDGGTITFDTDNAEGGKSSYAIPVDTPLSEPRVIPGRFSTPGMIYRPGNF